MQSARFLDRTRADGRVVEVEEEGDNFVQGRRAVERDAADVVELFDKHVADRQQRSERQQPVERDRVLRRGRLGRGGRHRSSGRALVEQHEPLQESPLEHHQHIHVQQLSIGQLSRHYHHQEGEARG
mgnify:CR=1 FL=1